MRQRRRVVALVAAVAVAGTLVFPSGAAPLFSGPTDDVGEDVELAPSSDYAYIEDGELVVDISASNPELAGEGVNANALTGFDDVFRMRYNGSRYAHVWLTHDSEAVSLHVDGEPVESEANNVTLAPNQTVAVGLTVDTRGETPDGLLEDITVHAKVADPEDAEAADADAFEFEGAGAQTRAPTADSRRFTLLGGSTGEVYRFDALELELDRAGGGALTLDEVLVENADGSLSMGIEAVAGESSRDLVLTEGGAEPLGAARVTVDTGAVANATLRYSVPQSYLDAVGVAPGNLAVYRDDDGDLSRIDVEVLGERDGRVRFAAETPGFSTFVVAADRARLAVADAALNRTTVAPSEPVAVSATVTNDGSIEGERTVPVTVNGEVVAELAVAVDADETATVTVPVALEAAGEYDVAVGSVDAGTFVVEAPSDPSDQATEQPPADQSDDVEEPAAPDPTEEASGFGLSDLLGLVALLGIVAATLLLARRVPWR